MNLESANLILRTSSIAVGTDKDANRTNVTWRNINMKAVLGTLYDKYDRFKICLTSVGNANTSTLTAVADRAMIVNMTGLPWENQTFDSATNTNTNTSVIGTVLYVSTAGFSVNLTGEIGMVFTKPSQYNVDINISIARVSDGLLNNTINYGESVYCFAIYGVEE